MTLYKTQRRVAVGMLRMTRITLQWRPENVKEEATTTYLSGPSRNKLLGHNIRFEDFFAITIYFL